MSAVVPRLEMRQGQSLVMTQQLQQSIKLLQLSSIELAEYITQELEKNPLLTAEEQESEPRVEEGEGEAPAAEAAGETSEEAAEPKGADSDEWPETQQPDDSAFDDRGYDSDTSGGSFEAGTRSHSGIGEEGLGFESYTASEVSLRDTLLNQLNVEVSDPAQRMIGQHLIDLVDESGYIKEDTTAIAHLLGCDDAMIDATFAVLHTFDPPGVCARNLAECLAIQLRDRNRFDPAMEKLLQHLDLMAKGDMEALRKVCGVDAEDLKEMCAEIRGLNPRPGSGFQHEAVQAIVPDVFLRRAKIKDGGNGWQVELNSAVLPRVLVNRRYLAQISTKTRGKEEKKYLSDQLAAGKWLIKALDQRAQTIIKISAEIVAQQDAFFRQGIRYLRPLTLREVAAAVNLHESTVSRVTTSKYMATPRGTYELKYFFNASIQNADGGESYSNKTVQYLIKELVDQERPGAILSDDTIAEQLKARGIDVARRTVAKYRDLMHIPSSSVRKREKAGKD